MGDNLFTETEIVEKCGKITQGLDKLNADGIA